MSTITISLPDDRLQKLQEMATQFNIAPEELARASIEEFLTRPEEEFQRVLEYVLSKNKEIYQQLA
jgi:predicted transcriptional regulator